MSVAVALLLLAQTIALIVLITRLLPGRRRRPPVLPIEDSGPPRVSVLLPTYNEVQRLQPCLEGLMRQGASVSEILVIDGNSSDGTIGLVDGARARDARVRRVQEPPLPNGWIGKVWALQQGLEQTAGEWVLNVDADIEPAPGMVAAALKAAEELDLAVVSFSPCFAGQTAAEQWVQAALLVTLVYRGGGVPASGMVPAHRTMANGQCFLARRDVLLRHGGYAPARASFSDDVTLARYLARRGVRVGFLDGSRMFRVRSYSSLGEMWREWGRSIDLRDATSTLRLMADVLFLILVQGTPLFVLVTLLRWGLGSSAWIAWGLVVANVPLVAIRLAIMGALRPAYAAAHPTYWLSPLADPLAIARIALSSFGGLKTWRGRRY
jgi:dolichol-phosphate mannosyltransferase